MATEIAMLHDVSKCTACRGCMVACKQWKGLPAEKEEFTGEYQSHKDLTPNTLNLIRMEEIYENGKLEWVFRKSQCMHCGVPSCAKACPQGALEKSQEGPVKFYEDKCIGCGYCEHNCPFGIPKIDEDRDKSTKCDLCIDRLAQGMVPSCAKTCTADAIFFGTRKEMTAKAQKRLEAMKDKYPNAVLYGVDKTDGVGGTSMMYILTDSPEKFGLPADPQVPKSIGIWKDYVQPGGKILLGVTAGAVAGAFIMNSVMKKDKSDDKEEHKDDSQHQ